MTIYEFCDLIIQEHEKAIAKHPVFCTELCDISKASYERLAETSRTNNDQDEAAGNFYADSIVMEEIYETFEAAYNNDLEAMAHEAAQACQTLYRALQHKTKELEQTNCRQSMN